MLGLLTAITIGFNTVVLAQAQTIAPGPAAPGGPYPYGAASALPPAQAGAVAPRRVLRRR